MTRTYWSALPRTVKKKNYALAAGFDQLSKHRSHTDKQQCIPHATIITSAIQFNQNLYYLQIEELYTALLYITQHQIGFDETDDVRQDAVVDYLQKAFNVDAQAHERVMEETRQMEVSDTYFYLTKTPRPQRKRERERERERERALTLERKQTAPRVYINMGFELKHVLQAPEMHLNIEVLEAKELVPKDANGKSDPFCVLYLESQPTKRYNTTVKPETLTPVWQEHIAL